MTTPSTPTVYASYLHAYVSRLCDGSPLDARLSSTPTEADLIAMALGSLHATSPVAKPWTREQVDAEVKRMLGG